MARPSECSPLPLSTAVLGKGGVTKGVAGGKGGVAQTGVAKGVVGKGGGDDDDDDDDAGGGGMTGGVL